MARQRRGGGRGGGGFGSFRPPELRGTLGTLINTALSQAGVVRDAIERGAREGRARLDDVRVSRRRNDALAELGEIVLDLIRRGEIDLAELPEVQDIVRFLDELDEDHPRGASSEDDDRDRDREIARPAARRRFDDRDRPRARDDGDDGTVSAAKPWAPRKPSAPQRVWRPQVEPTTPAEPPPRAASPREPRRLPNNPDRKGGITFDDEDLAEYMHPDDVPPKPSPDGDA